MMKWTESKTLAGILPADHELDRIFDAIVAYYSTLPGISIVKGGVYPGRYPSNFSFGITASFSDGHGISFELFVYPVPELGGPPWEVDYEIDWDLEEGDVYPVIPLGRCMARTTEELTECLKNAAAAFLREPCLSFAAARDQQEAARIAAQYEEGRQRCSDPR